MNSGGIPDDKRQPLAGTMSQASAEGMTNMIGFIELTIEHTQTCLVNTALAAALVAAAPS